MSANFGTAITLGAAVRTSTATRDACVALFEPELVRLRRHLVATRHRPVAQPLRRRRPRRGAIGRARAADNIF